MDVLFYFSTFIHLSFPLFSLSSIFTFSHLHIFVYIWTYFFTFSHEKVSPYILFYFYTRKSMFQICAFHNNRVDLHRQT